MDVEVGLDCNALGGDICGSASLQLIVKLLMKLDMFNTYGVNDVEN